MKGLVDTYALHLGVFFFLWVLALLMAVDKSMR